MNTVIKTLTDFEQLLVIAKRHNLTHFKFGEIEVAMPLQEPEKEKPTYVNEEPPSADEIDATIYRTTLNM